MNEYQFHVDADHAQERIDVFLAHTVPESPSRTFIQGLIEKGEVLVNQRTVKAHHRVVVGDRVVVHVPPMESGWEQLSAEKIRLNIFYEDENLLVINKPEGMLVHPVHGVNTGTLVNALLYYCQQLSAGSEPLRPGIVHRLDRETSGLMIVAKDNRTHVQLAQQFEKHEVRKKYVALVRGTVEFEEGEIDAPLGRHYRRFDKKMVSYDDSAKEARTRYRVIHRFQDRVTLVALFPESGRTHQLRVHMAHVGHSILGDDKYGVKDSFYRLALHAQGIGFRHPGHKSWVEFYTPIPEEFLRYKVVSK